MANYINLTLDTIAPSGISVLLNGGVTSTTSTAVTLGIECAEAEQNSDYQMKIWGTASAQTEAEAQWETFQNTKQITLPAGDGTKTVYVKVRDDVWNESATVSDSISFYGKIPTVNVSANVSKLSFVNGKNVTMLNFVLDEECSEIKVMIVNNINDAHNASTNIAIPTANGSYLDFNDSTYQSQSNTLEYAVSGNDNFQPVLGQFATIYAADIAQASPGDGVKIVKVFVKSAVSGNWSA